MSSGHGQSCFSSLKFSSMLIWGDTHTHTHTHRDTQRHTHTHRDTQRHTHTHTHTDTDTDTHTHTHTHTHRDTHAHTRTHTHTHRDRQSHTQRHTHTDTQTQTQTHTHTHTHTDTHTHTHTDTDTDTHTHRYINTRMTGFVLQGNQSGIYLIKIISNSRDLFRFPNRWRETDNELASCNQLTCSCGGERNSLVLRAVIAADMFSACITSL